MDLKDLYNRNRRKHSHYNLSKTISNPNLNALQNSIFRPSSSSNHTTIKSKGRYTTSKKPKQRVQAAIETCENLTQKQIDEKVAKGVCLMCICGKHKEKWMKKLPIVQSSYITNYNKDFKQRKLQPKMQFKPMNQLQRSKQQLNKRSTFQDAYPEHPVQRQRINNRNDHYRPGFKFQAKSTHQEDYRDRELWHDTPTRPMNNLGPHPAKFKWDTSYGGFHNEKDLLNNTAPIKMHKITEGILGQDDPDFSTAFQRAYTPKSLQEIEKRMKPEPMNTSYAPEHFQSMSRKEHAPYSLEHDGWPLDRPGIPAYSYEDHINKKWKWHLWTCGGHIWNVKDTSGPVIQPTTEKERSFKPKKPYEALQALPAPNNLGFDGKMQLSTQYTDDFPAKELKVKRRPQTAAARIKPSMQFVSRSIYEQDFAEWKGMSPPPLCDIKTPWETNPHPFKDNTTYGTAFAQKPPPETVPKWEIYQMDNITRKEETNYMTSSMRAFPRHNSAQVPSRRHKIESFSTITGGPGSWVTESRDNYRGDQNPRNEEECIYNDPKARAHIDVHHNNPHNICKENYDMSLKFNTEPPSYTEDMRCEPSPRSGEDLEKQKVLEASTMQKFDFSSPTKPLETVNEELKVSGRCFSPDVEARRSQLQARHEKHRRSKSANSLPVDQDAVNNPEQWLHENRHSKISVEQIQELADKVMQSKAFAKFQPISVPGVK